MTTPPPKSELTADKALLANYSEDQASPTEYHSVSGSRGRSQSTKKDAADQSQKHLRAPSSRPARPMSPDASSILSTDEYEQLAPQRSRSQPSQIHSSAERSEEQSESWRSRLRTLWTRNKGIAYMLMAQVFGVLMNVTTRLLEVEGNKGKGLHPFQILFARMAITVVLASAWMWYKKTPDFPLGKPEVRWLLVARGLSGFFGVWGMYTSLQYLPLADCTVLTFLAPGLVCWLCAVLLKEPFTRREQVATLISFLGVVMIARPTSLFSKSGETPPASGPGDAEPGAKGKPSSGDASDFDNVTPEERLYAVSIALLGVCGTVIAFTSIRWIGKRAHPLISVNYFSVWCTIVSFVMQLALPGVGFLLPADLKEWSYLIFLGICGFIMVSIFSDDVGCQWCPPVLTSDLQQFLLAAGLAYEKSSRATNMTYTQMLFALTFDKIIFGHSPGWMSIIGSSLILGPAIFVAMQKNVDESKEANEGSQGPGDEESQRALLSGEAAEERLDSVEGDGIRMPVPEVQMRALR